MSLTAETICLEAGGEPDQGKLGVGWVIRRRQDRHGQTANVVILAPLQFSCWAGSARSHSLALLAQADEAEREACYRAAAGAFWRLSPDPTGGALNYFNERETRLLHGGTLPPWAQEILDSGKAVIIGKHTFGTA